MGVVCCCMLAASLSISGEGEWLMWRTIWQFVCPSVCLSVRKVYFGKTVEWIWMPLGMVSGVARGMRSWSLEGKGQLGEFGAYHCNQRGLCDALFPNYVGQDLLKLLHSCTKNRTLNRSQWVGYMTLKVTQCYGNWVDFIGRTLLAIIVVLLNCQHSGHWFSVDITFSVFAVLVLWCSTVILTKPF